MIQNCYEEYIRALKKHAEQQEKSIKNQEFEEIKSHIFNYVQEKGETTSSEKQLQSLIYKEFGSPQELLDNMSLESQFKPQPKKGPPFHLILAMIAIAVTLFTPYKYAPIGFLFLFIALHALITKDPFAFAYYKKNPDKVNYRAPLWIYSGIVFCLGVVFLILEWSPQI